MVFGWHARHARGALLRTKHVRLFLKGFIGFCGHCGMALTTKDVNDNKCRYCRRVRQYLVPGLEDRSIEVDVNGKKYSTDNTNWRRTTVQGNDVFTKVVDYRPNGRPVIALVHRIEAGQLNIIKSLNDDATLLVPSLRTGWHQIVSPKGSVSVRGYFRPQELEPPARPESDKWSTLVAENVAKERESKMIRLLREKTLRTEHAKFWVEEAPRLKEVAKLQRYFKRVLKKYKRLERR